MRGRHYPQYFIDINSFSLQKKPKNKSYNDQMSELGPREFKKHAQSHIARTGFKLEFV